MEADKEAGPTVSHCRTALERIRVVLVSTSHTGNIGAAARAMKTMGLTRLTLVTPKKLPDREAFALASAAGDVLAAARISSSLREALEGTVAAFGLSARSRDLSHEAMSVRSAAREAVRCAVQGDVAFVFGGEMSGLSNEELILCGKLVHIPADPECSSLNLAQAVQVAAYEVRVAATGGSVPGAHLFPPAPHEDVERFFEHLERALVRIEFLDPAQPKRLMERLRRLFVRARLEQEEVNILRGILTAVDAGRDRAANERQRARTQGGA